MFFYFATANSVWVCRLFNTARCSLSGAGCTTLHRNQCLADRLRPRGLVPAAGCAALLRDKFSKLGRRLNETIVRKRAWRWLRAGPSRGRWDRIHEESSKPTLLHVNPACFVIINAYIEHLHNFVPSYMSVTASPGKSRHVPYNKGVVPDGKLAPCAGHLRGSVFRCSHGRIRAIIYFAG